MPLWTNLYRGPGSGYHKATAVASDSSDNVVVVGYSLGSGTGYDYATIKYASTGVPLWTNRYNGVGYYTLDDQPMALAVDHSGNVVVTGYPVASAAATTSPL